MTDRPAGAIEIRVDRHDDGSATKIEHHPDGSTVLYKLDADGEPQGFVVALSADDYQRHVEVLEHADAVTAAWWPSPAHRPPHTPATTLSNALADVEAGDMSIRLYRQVRDDIIAPLLAGEPDGVKQW